MFRLILFSFFVGSALARSQAVGVQGSLSCDDKPAAGVVVKLYDDDAGPDLDDLLAEGTTDASGEFILAGFTEELTTIDPKLNIYHDCQDPLPCQRKFTILIPSSFIFNGSRPQTLYDIGRLELGGEYPSEERDCVH